MAITCKLDNELPKSSQTRFYHVARGDEGMGTIQSGLEQQDPTTWSEIIRQPLFGNHLLTSEAGIQWGTEVRSNMRWWSERGFRQLKDIVKEDEQGWKSFTELLRLRRTSVATALYACVLNSIPWEARPTPPYTIGQWLATKNEGETFSTIYHIQSIAPLEADKYMKEDTELLRLTDRNQSLPSVQLKEVRVLRCGGVKRTVLEFNPLRTERLGPEQEQSFWLWGNEWIRDMEWDPKDWQWRRIGILPDTSMMNYTTKRGYIIALKQNTQQMPLDVELEAEGFNSKARAKLFNQIWHPYLPRKVSAMQWLILTKGLPIGAWREKLGLSNSCEFCPEPIKETLKHAFQDCPQLS